jgi:SAM-dependent methyltransferase
MPRFVVEYGKVGKPPEPDGRLDAPAFHRNHEPIWSAIKGYLHRPGGNVLELGSGTGQHAAAFAGRTPHLVWWPSDTNEKHLASIAAWRKFARLENLRAPQRIDLESAAWTWRSDNDGPLVAMLCINVTHISPWAATQNLIDGAARFLQPGGHLFVYGPFMRAGLHTAPSNIDFDKSLRAKNPEWGVRDIADLNHLARKAGLSPAELHAMPSNNWVLVFARPLGQN